ncbi:MAG: hypothetical protein ABEH83_06190, partial [Halobacterium sp.]
MTGIVAGKNKSSGKENLKAVLNEAAKIREKKDQAAQKKARSIRKKGKANSESKAKEIREEAAHKKWEEYIESRGYSVTSSNFKPSFKQYDGEIGIEKVQDILTTGLDANLSIISSYYGDYYAIDFDFKLYFSVPCGTCGGEVSNGVDPKDAIGLSFKQSCWKWKEDNIYEDSSGSSNVEANDGRSYSDESFGFLVDDSGMMDDWSEDNGINDEGYSALEYGSIYLEPRDSSDCESSYDTRIRAVYDHTWSGSYA